MGIKSRSLSKSEIRRQPIDLPVAVAGRFGSVAARNFLGPVGCIAIPFGASCGSFRERALGRGRLRLFRGRFIVCHVAFGRLWRCRVGWHRF
jgi:hypothetical protein